MVFYRENTSVNYFTNLDLSIRKIVDWANEKLEKQRHIKWNIFRPLKLLEVI